MSGHKNRMTGGATHLSARFWQLADGLTSAWKLMNALLEQEWDMLKTRRMGGLWRIVREKESLASKLETLERMIDAEIPDFSPEESGAERRWKALCAASSSAAETARLNRWKSDLATQKRMAFETNRRLWFWIAQQQELAGRLANILAGNDEPRTLTYGSPGSPGTSSPYQRKGPHFSPTMQDTRGSITGISSKQVNRALEAYGVKNSSRQRTGSWD